MYAEYPRCSFESQALYLMATGFPLKNNTYLYLRLLSTIYLANKILKKSSILMIVSSFNPVLCIV